MPAYNFNKQFVPKVESGEKTQTIRGTARGATVGSTAYLYYAQRTKQCRKLGEGIITAVVPVEIGHDRNGDPYVTVGSHFIHHIDEFARADGFNNVEDFMAWFCGKDVPIYHGFLISWRNFKPFSKD